MNIYDLEKFDVDMFEFSNKYLTYNDIYWSLFVDLFNTGLRSCEILDKNRFTLLESGEYLIETAKGSNNRHLSTLYFSDLFNNAFSNGGFLYSGITYQRLDHIFKISWGSPNVFQHKKRLSTHLFRHMLCKSMYNDGFEVQEIADFMGEVNNKNILGYINSTIYI